MGPFKCFSLNPSKMLPFLLPSFLLHSHLLQQMMVLWIGPIGIKKRISKLLFISPKLPALNGSEPVLRPLLWRMVYIFLWSYWVFENMKDLTACGCAQDFYRRFMDSKSHVTSLVVPYIIIKALKGDSFYSVWLKNTRKFLDCLF